MSRNDVPSPPAPPQGAASPSLGNVPDPAAGDGLAGWVLRGPLAVALCGLALFQLATWVPHYLTWPFWADHDVFATMAQGWSEGRLPYRDQFCNNFPGTVYLFWVLGKLFGWGATVPFYAVDAAMVVALGAVLLAWSRRRMGGYLPGLVGYLAFLSYYLGLDYAHAAQRDWHGPFFAVLGLLVVQAWPGAAGRLASALAMALALVFRPQTILFLPALILAIDESRGAGDATIRERARRLSSWAIALAAFLIVGFLPILAAGVAGDFVRGVRLAAYGGHYNRVTPGSVVAGWIALMVPLKTSLVPLAIAYLARKADALTPARRVAPAWVVAILCVTLYKPLSPVAHTYLNIPLMLVWSVSLGVLVSLVLSMRGQSASLRLVATLMVLSLGVTMRPELCVFRPSLSAIQAFRQGRLPDERPPGYRRGTVETTAFYPWRDYRALIDYLKRETPRGTPIANVLKADPALTAPAARPSVFPVESIAWLRAIRPADEPRFAEALARTPGAVVVWIPGEVGPDRDFKIDRLEATIREHYEPETHFGKIEVWKRKDAIDSRLTRND